MGERVLCKHEVVGSIPSASTKLRLVEREAAGENVDDSVLISAIWREDYDTEFPVLRKRNGIFGFAVGGAGSSLGAPGWACFERDI